jgi:transcriptional regulator with PAS, ATPase and Fis domain
MNSARTPAGSSTELKATTGRVWPSPKIDSPELAHPERGILGQDAREAYEARYISQVLTEHGGNVSHAAVALRLSRVALQKKMKRYGLR